jgi:hypothetical protein
VQPFSALSELVCGAGYVPDWEAISAIATAAAVIVALWISVRDRRIRNVERLETEARAADLVAQSLAGLIEVMPSIISKIKEMKGAMLDVPGNNVIYGTDECKRFVAREAFVHQLPTSYLGEGEFAVSLARKWCSEIETRILIQRDKSLREAIDWREHEFVCSLGDKFHAALISLREKCWHTRHEYEKSRKSWILRLLWPWR